MSKVFKREFADDIMLDERGLKRKFSLVILVLLIVFIVLNFVLGFIWYESYFHKPDVRGSRVIGGNAQADISFTIEEQPTPTPAPAAAAAAGGGGGSGGGTAPTRKVLYDFKIDQTLIKVSSKVGETFKKSVTVSNPNDVALRFTVFTNMENMLYISEESFELPAGEDKTIYLTFVATEDVKPDVYTGKVLFRTQYSEKELPVIYEVRSKKSLFDVSLNIPAKYKSLRPGDDLFFQVTLLNLGEIGKVDVLMEYEIKDFDGKIIAAFDETVAVETQASFSKTIKLPDDIASGDYVILARAKHGLSVATASDLFNVEYKEFIFLSPENQFMFLFGLVLLILLILLFIIYELRKMRLREAAASQHKKAVDLKKKIRSGNISAKDAELEIKKLNYQRRLLEEAYSKGYIKKDSYESGIAEINRLISSLKKRR